MFPFIDRSISPLTDMGAQYFHIPYCPGTSFGVCVTAIVPNYESTSGSRYTYVIIYVC